MQSHDVPTIALVLGMVLLVGLLGFWQAGLSEKILYRWAEENGFQILSCEQRWFFRGPFFWTTSKHQDVYYVIVQDRNGRRRNGLVRCGSFWPGLLSDRAEVRWED